jgi:hypothetical protein
MPLSSFYLHSGFFENNRQKENEKISRHVGTPPTWEKSVMEKA